MEWVKFESQMRWFDGVPAAGSQRLSAGVRSAHRGRGSSHRPSAVGRYARDSLRTKAMRRLAPHFEHRLFLTATPHNGYPESFQALLEMLDPNRFTKGVPPSERERDAVMVRRLKSHLRSMLPDGAKRFPQRRIAAIDVEFPPEERELFDLLDGYAALRMGSASTPLRGGVPVRGAAAQEAAAVLAGRVQAHSRPARAHTQRGSASPDH